MEWEVFKLDQTGGRTAPFVSIGRGQLDFNAVACELVGDDGQQNGKSIQGMTVRNKDAIERLFGKDGSNKGMVRHKVEPIGENILKIID